MLILSDDYQMVLWLIVMCDTDGNQFIVTPLFVCMPRYWWQHFLLHGLINGLIQYSGSFICINILVSRDKQWEVSSTSPSAETTKSNVIDTDDTRKTVCNI